MNRIELGTKLAGIAEVLTGKEAAVVEKGATEMLKLAKELVSFDPPAELQKGVEALAALAADFKTGHKDLIAKVAKMETDLKEQQKVLSSYFKGWEVQSGYRKMRGELLAQAEICMAIGDSLSDLSGEVTVSRRESEQESYKEKYNVLVSTLNEAELNKYGRILKAFYRKQYTEVDAGPKLLNGEVKEWHASAQAIAEERGIKMPKAGMKEAGFVGDIVDALKSIIPDLISRVTNWVSDMYSKIVKNGEVLNVLDAKLGRMVAKARAAL
jgi:hypothetical protein